MVRPLRIEYPGAVYHITSRGDRREPIAKDDEDRALFLEVVGEATRRFDARVWAYCLMGNHYHLVLRTRKANLSRLMRQINGVYTQRFNRRHALSGHLFQGRFKAILVDSDSYLLEVCRYVDLNPVRAHMVKRPEAYVWSSYRALAGLTGRPDWLDAKVVYEQIATGKSAARAAAKYAEFVAQGKGVPLWDEHLRQQIYLGDDAFIVRMQKLAGIDSTTRAADERGQKPPWNARQKPNVSKIHTSAPVRDGDLKRYAAMKCRGKDQRNQNIADAFYQGGHSQTAIALAFDVSTSTVSRVVAAFERGDTP
jgi:REP element-mobilizing transposase RayT